MNPKSIFLVTLFLLFQLFSKAEYQGYHIEVEFEMMWGETKKGYAFITAYDFNKDSIHDQQHLKRVFQNSVGENNRFYFGKNRIRYCYNPEWDQKQEFCLYDLVGKDSVHVYTVKKFKVLSVHDQRYSIGFRNVFSMSDTSWLNTPVLEQISVSGYFCSHSIFVHKKKEENNVILKKIQALELQISAMSNSDLDENMEEVDKWVDELIEQLKLEGVVVISECTC